MAIAHHVTLRLADDRALATSPAAYRRAASCLHRHGRAVRLIAFCVADTHLHALVVCDGAAARRFAVRLALALQKTLVPGVAFDRARIRPIVDQRHLYSTFHYIRRQHEHHGIASDPFHDGSHFPDVVGLRIIDPALEAAVRGHLPRLEIELPPRGDLRVEYLAEASAAALALPDLARRSRDHVLARAAAVHVGSAGHTTNELARVLELGRSTVDRLRRCPVPHGVLHAVEGQARWRAAHALATAATLVCRPEPPSALSRGARCDAFANNRVSLAG